MIVTSIIMFLLNFIIMFALAFGVSFIVITLFINKQRKVQPKYHFVGTADTVVDVDLGDEEIFSPVDNQNARTMWNR